MKRLYSVVAWIQAIYIVVTALWALLDIHSFMEVTGRKNDVWLVKTVSACLLPISLCLILSQLLKTHPLLTICVAMATCSGLASIDFYYTANGTIKWIYAVDGAVEVVFLITWTYLLFRLKQWRQAS